MNELVYLSYGDDKYHFETMFSILTAKKFKTDEDNYTIIVYTDKPSHYKWLGVSTKFISSDIIEEWIGHTAGYPFRRKVKCIIDRLKYLDGKLVFVDGDTYFTSSPSELFNRVGKNKFCLHVPEIRLTRREGTAGYFLHKVFDHHVILWPDNTPIFIGKGEVMWNSGVIGIHSNDIEKMEVSLKLIDDIWIYERSLHTLEQFALGHVFQKYGSIAQTDDLVFHYWSKRQRLPLIKKLPSIILKAKTMPLADAVNWAYFYRPTEPMHRKIFGILRETLHRLGLNHRWTRTSY